MLALVPPENESPRSLNDDPSSISKRGKYRLLPKYCVAAGGKPRLAGSKIPWFWTDARLLEARPARPHVQQRRVRHRPHVVDVQRVVDPVEVVAGRLCR